MNDRLTRRHLERKAVLYVRQSSQFQVVHNQESRRLQYDMERRLSALGWREIEIIDEDLGRSATTTADRTGFQSMVAQVCLGKVGAIAAREVSRFARNNRDWYQLVEVCSLVDTLLIDHEALYDPRRPNDRLLLGLKGNMSEYELDLLRQRSLAARRAKAARGELVIEAPVGFIKTADQRLEKEPDRRVQRAIELVFKKFSELGSARQAFMWFIEHGLDFPAKRQGPEGLETWWRRPSYQSVVSILTEPVYSGAYAYGRTGARTRVRNGRVEKTRYRKPLEDWSVLIPNHHEGYISWNEFERIQGMLSANSTHFFQSSGPGAAKKGPAMLAGLIRCRRCGRKMMVTYSGRNANIPRYCCHRGHLDKAEPTCISIGGRPLNAAVGRELLRVLRPCAIDAAKLAVSQDNKRRDDLIDTLVLELKAAQFDADRAGRQFDAVDPANRLVADELENRWNTALERVDEIQVRIEEERSRLPAQPPDKSDVAGLYEDVEAAWIDPDTDVRLKKRIIRTLIDEIILDIDEDANEVEAVIHWNGGLHSALRIPRRRRGQNAAHTSPDIVDAVRVLARVCTDETIAAFLNRNGFLTGRGNRWTKERVTSLRSKRKIPRCTPERKQAGGWLNMSEAAVYAGVTNKTLRRAVERGVLKALHPLSDGPWVFEAKELDRARDRLKVNSNPPAGPTSEQMNLEIPST